MTFSMNPIVMNLTPVAPPGLPDRSWRMIRPLRSLIKGLGLDSHEKIILTFTAGSVIYIMLRISVIIPTYQAGPAIVRAIAGIRKSALDSDIEILVVDDGSSDPTAGTAEKMGAKVLSTGYHRGGPNPGRNIGLQNASGDFIAFLDQDDEWMESKLRIQIEAMKATGVSLSFTEFDVRDDRTNRIFLYGTNDGRTTVSAENEIFLKCLRKDKKHFDNPYLSSLVISRDLAGIRFEEKYGLSDFDYILKIFEGRRAVKIGIPLVCKHVTGDNLSLDGQYREIDFDHSMDILHQYENTYPRQVRTARRRLHGTLGRYRYLMGNMREARRQFIKAEFSWKTALYLLTSFWGSGFVKRHFRIFGT
jgi:glycosyltransferase involved in cell wall biosynthesis